MAWEARRTLLDLYLNSAFRRSEASAVFLGATIAVIVQHSAIDSATTLGVFLSYYLIGLLLSLAFFRLCKAWLWSSWATRIFWRAPHPVPEGEDPLSFLTRHYDRLAKGDGEARRRTRWGLKILYFFGYRLASLPSLFISPTLGLVLCLLGKYWWHLLV